MTTKRIIELKVRVSADEYRRLAELARGRGSLAGFLRDQAFNRETVRRLGSIHGAVLEVARLVGDRAGTMDMVQALAHLVAIEAGFRHPEHFERLFKKTFGQTPREFLTERERALRSIGIDLAKCRTGEESYPIIEFSCPSLRQ
ncbi:MAG: AraC family transcriptional regulator [Verrucomicrobia bacterium]|nr:AraC family transcriptional regulator [Verrucomicrobiota bacterium]